MIIVIVMISIIFILAPAIFYICVVQAATPGCTKEACAFRDQFGKSEIWEILETFVAKNVWILWTKCLWKMCTKGACTFRDQFRKLEDSGRIMLLKLFGKFWNM